MQKKKNFRTLLLLVLNFIILFAVYQLFLRLELLWGTALYLIAAAALSIAYYVINRGFGRPEIDPESLPKAWPPQKKCEYIEERNAAHARAKKLLYWLFPIVVVLAIDFIGLFLWDGVISTLDALG